MKELRSIAAVLAAYPIGQARTVPLGSAGGFSGAEFWKVETADETLCLRRWPPEHPLPDRLQYIHDVLRHVFDQGILQVALPRRTRSGATFIAQGGHLWELTPWMPGTADYHHQPTREKLAAAMRLLARFHLAAASFGGEWKPARPSPGLRQRLDLTDRLLDGEARRIAAAIESERDPRIESRSRRILDAFFSLAPTVRRSLVTASQCRVPLQPCLRDIWHDHVLFSGDEVTGIVDFGALRDECIAGDVARLLGSLVRVDDAAWRFGLAIYQQTRVLTADESLLLGAFHETNALLSGMNWLRWIFLEGRRFEEPALVLSRMDENLENLSNLQTRIAASMPGFTET